MEPPNQLPQMYVYKKVKRKKINSEPCTEHTICTSILLSALSATVDLGSRCDS